LRQLTHKAKHASATKYKGRNTEAFDEEINYLTRNAFIMGLVDPQIRIACFAQGDEVEFEKLVNLAKNIETNQSLSKGWSETRIEKRIEPISVNYNQRNTKSQNLPT
jgi:hypothetical protein